MESLKRTKLQKLQIFCVFFHQRNGKKKKNSVYVPWENHNRRENHRRTWQNLESSREKCPFGTVLHVEIMVIESAWQWHFQWIPKNDKDFSRWIMTCHDISTNFTHKIGRCFRYTKRYQHRPQTVQVNQLNQIALSTTLFLGFFSTVYFCTSRVYFRTSRVSFCSLKVYLCNLKIYLYFESILLYLESIPLYFESIPLYFESILLYFESTFVYFESILLYFQSILLYFESIL